MFDFAARAKPLIEAGAPVFPCCDARGQEGDKKPLCNNGFKDATTDPQQIATWAARYPDALVGVPTGRRTGLFVVDADIDKRTGETIGEATLYDLGGDFAAHGHCVTTRSGGLHLFYRWSEGLLNTVKRLPGVDTRGEGGYVIAWDPEALAEAITDPNLPPPPEHLLAALAAGRSGQALLTPNRPATALPSPNAPWAQAALADECARVWRAAKGARNNTLNCAAFCIGQIVGAGWLDFAEAEKALLAAAAKNGVLADEPQKTRDTIARGLRDGIKHPRGPQPGPSGAGFGDSGGSFPRLGEEDWPALVPFGEENLPKLDADTLPAWLRDFAVALAAQTETPLELTAAMTLATASAAVARRAKVIVREGYCEPCNVWLLAALPSGTRKSAVQKDAVAPLKTWEHEKEQALAADIAEAESLRDVADARAKEVRKQAAQAESSEEADRLAREAAQIEMDAPTVPSPPRLWTSDCTPEQLGVRLAQNSERLAWLSAEGGVFDILAGRYTGGAANLDLILKTHSGDPERVERISRAPINLREPLLTMALAPQPDVLRGLADRPHFRGRGLLARFLYFLPPSPLGRRTGRGQPIPPAVAAAYERGIRALLDWPEATEPAGEAAVHELRLRDKAMAVFDEFFRTIESALADGAALAEATDWGGKAPGAAARVAGVFHAIEHAGAQPERHFISEQTMQRACAFVSVSMAHTLAVFGLMAADDATAKAQRLLQWIQRRGYAAFSARDAYQGLKGAAAFQRTADVEAGLDVLEERGYVLKVNATAEAASPGRPKSQHYKVRPELAGAEPCR